jgi:hypothetical protein
MNYQIMPTEQEQEVKALRQSLIEAKCRISELQTTNDNMTDEIDRWREVERSDKLLFNLVRAAGSNISWFQVARMLAVCNREQRATLKTVRAVMTDYVWLGGLVEGAAEEVDDFNIPAAGRLVGDALLRRVGKL